jgi:hypothetical protein
MLWLGAAIELKDRRQVVPVRTLADFGVHADDHMARLVVFAAYWKQVLGTPYLEQCDKKDLTDEYMGDWKQ